MKLLSIDTSSDVCSVALLEDDKLIKQIDKTDSKTHSENLMPLIDLLFKETNYSLSDIEAIACSIGPGSFTGIRIGIASVKAMAEVLQIPVIGVTSLETLSYLVSSKNNIATLIDAKNNQVYAGIFDANHQLLENYMADDIHEVISHLKPYLPLTFVGNGALLHQSLLQEKLGNISFADNHFQSAFSLGKCAYEKWQKGEVLTADTLLPLYLRKSQAERMKQSNGV